MTLYQYPQNDFDRPDVLLGVLGSFWAHVYQGNVLLEELTSAAGQAAQQTYGQLMELLNSISRYNVPLYHRNNWYALTIRQSQLQQATAQLATYVTPPENTYTTPTSLAYGVPTITETYFAVDKPAGLAEVQTIFNRLVEPSVELFEGLDYRLTDTQIRFRQDPFQNSKIAQREVLNAAGEITDRELVLWLYRGQWDWEYVYRQFGYALRLQLQTSEGYKQFVNAIFDAFNTGTSLRHQQLALSAAFGVPLVIETTETVEEIAEDSAHLNIVTNRHVYQFPKGTAAIVQQGQTVHAGDPLTDLLQIYELNRGETPNIRELTLGAGVLACGYYGDLTFTNAEVSLIVEPDVEGYTKISWETGGFVHDVEKFWEDVHAAGIAKGQTLAMLLDRRAEPVGQPLAASLPATINPLQFFVQNLLRNNAVIVKVRPGSRLGQRLAFVPAEQLRKIQPPQSLLIFVVELVYRDDPVIMEAPGTELQPGYTETVGGFPCVVTADSLTPGACITERVRTSQIGGHCI